MFDDDPMPAAVLIDIPEPLADAFEQDDVGAVAAEVLPGEADAVSAGLVVH